MQQPARRQLGTAGETAVSLFFEDIGWGPLATGNHDLGTDFFVQIRNQELIDLRMMIGVQVKTGDSWFDEPGTLDDDSGWWYRETDKKHAEYWINHHIRHIIVLQSEDRERRFWNFVDKKTIVDTGAGFKVFIPDSQDLTDRHIPAWIEAASEARKLVAFEGSNWEFSIDDLGPEESVRYALLTPRLVSPHVNKGYSRELTWVEAIGLCIEAEPSRWDHFASQQKSVPSADEALESDDWGWRFAGAVYKWLCEGEINHLQKLDPTDAEQWLRVARAVCLGIALVERDELDQALELLDSAIDPDQMTVSQGWLGVQKARILQEVGNGDEAELVLKRANVQLAASNHDVTVSAIRSAAISALYELSDAIPLDLSEILTAMDTTAGWWRSQLSAAGLESAAKRYFKAWARDRSIVFGATDVPHNKLLASALVARLTGAHGSWRAAMTLMAMVDLSSERPQESRPLEALDSLRRAGNVDLLSLAIKRIRDEGPYVDLVDLMAGMSADVMTRTAVPSDLAVLRHAGAYCTADQSAEYGAVLLDALGDRASFVARYSMAIVPEMKILDALAGLVYQLPLEQEIRILDYITSLPDAPDQLLSGPLKELSLELSPDALNSRRSAVVDRALQMTEKNWYYWLLLAFAGPDDSRSRAAIGQGLLDGNFQALFAIGTYSRMTSDEVGGILRACAEGFEGYRQDSRINAVSGFAYDFGAIYAATALEFSDVADWSPLLDFLNDRAIYQGRKRSACRWLADNVNSIPTAIRGELRQIADGLCTDPGLPNPPAIGGLPDVGGAFVELYLELAADAGEDASISTRLAAILAGTQAARKDAASYLSRRSGHEMTLLAMTREENFTVSRWAMYCLARRACQSDELDAAYTSALSELLRSDGEANADHIMQGFASQRPVPPHAAVLFAEAEHHPSARIRRRVRELSA
jgi:hypothetical protein